MSVLSPGRPVASGAVLYGGGVAAALGLAYVGARDPRAFVLAACLVAAAAVALASFRWPRWALVATVPLVLLAGTKFRRRAASATLEGEVDGQVAFELLLYALLAMVLLSVVLSGAVRLRRLTLLEGVLLAFVAVAAASTLWSSAPLLTAVRSGQLLLLYCLALLLVRALGPARAARMLAVTLVVGVLLLSAAAAVFPWARGFVAPGRFSWLAMHPISCATLAGAAFLFVLREVLPGGDGERRPRGLPGRALVLPVAAVALLAVVLLARSRGPLLALSVASLVLLARRYLRGWQANLLVSCSLILAMVSLSSGLELTEVVAYGAASGNPLLEFVYRGQTGEEVLSLTGRAALWAEAMAAASDRALLGYGYQGSRGVLLEMYSWAGYAHNALLQTLLDTGLAGLLLLWGAIVGTILAVLFRTTGAPTEDRHQSFAFAAVVFLVVGSLTNESFAAAPGYEILLLMVCLAAAAGRPHGAGSRPPERARPSGAPLPQRGARPRIVVSHGW